MTSLKGRRNFKFSGQPVPVLSYPHSKNEQIPDVHTDPLVLPFMSIASGPVTETFPLGTSRFPSESSLLQAVLSLSVFSHVKGAPVL